MLQCSVLECSNSSETASKDVAFYKFPAPGPDLDMWVLASGRQDWTPPCDAVMCSDHFDSGSFVMVARLRVLIKKLLPTKNIHICRVCLCTDRKLYNLNKHSLTQSFQLVTGLVVHESSEYQFVCWECRSKLKSAIDFRNRAIEANNILSILLDDPSYLSRIPQDRETHKLSSKLQTTVHKPNHTTHSYKFEYRCSTVGAKTAVNNTKTRPRADKKATAAKLLKVESITIDKKPFFNLQVVNIDAPSELDADRRTDVTNNVIPIEFEAKSAVTMDVGDVLMDNDEAKFDVANDIPSDNVQDGMATEPTSDMNSQADSIGFNVDIVKLLDVETDEVSNNKTRNEMYDKGIDIKVEQLHSSDDDVTVNSDVKTKVFKRNSVVIRGRVQKRVAREKSKVGIDNKSRKILIEDNSARSVKEEGVSSKPPRMEYRKRRRRIVKVNVESEPNPKIFDVKELTFEEQLLEIERRKESENYKNAPYKCDYCYQGYRNKNSFKIHIAGHSDQAGPIECEVCKKRFKERRPYHKHVSKHRLKLSCKLCPYVCCDNPHAKRHEKFHDGVKYKCRYCPEVYNHMSSYQNHLRTRHKTDIVCELCGNCFFSLKGLHLHKSLKHSFEDQQIPPDGPECLVCKIQFLNQKALDRHLKESSRHADPSKRRLLRRRLDNEKPRKVERVHGPINCEQCEEQLPNFKAYYHHFKRAHPGKNRTRYPIGPYTCMCEVCGKLFHCRALMDDHKCFDSNDKEFECSVCGKRFLRKYRLIQHLKLHNNEPRQMFPCNICGKLFTEKKNMDRHVFNHSGLRPFKCEICEKAFKSKAEKESHVSYVHLKKPWPKRNRGKRLKTRQKSQDSD